MLAGWACTGPPTRRCAPGGVARPLQPAALQLVDRRTGRASSRSCGTAGRGRPGARRRAGLRAPAAGPRTAVLAHRHSRCRRSPEALRPSRRSGLPGVRAAVRRHRPRPLRRRDRPAGHGRRPPHRPARPRTRDVVLSALLLVPGSARLLVATADDRPRRTGPGGSHPDPGRHRAAKRDGDHRPAGAVPAATGSNVADRQARLPDDLVGRAEIWGVNGGSSA